MSQRSLQVEDDETNNSTIIESICLEHGHNYTFSIFDSFGDGVSLSSCDLFCLYIHTMLN